MQEEERRCAIKIEGYGFVNLIIEVTYPYLMIYH